MDHSSAFHHASPVLFFLLSLVSFNLELALCTTYTTPATTTSEVANYTDEARRTALTELQAVYDVMAATGNTWARDIPDVCLQRWHGIECSERSDGLLHVTSLSFGVISDDTAFPVCAHGSSISPSIQNLPYLKHLLYYQCCTGKPSPIPKEIGRLGASLERLVLRENGHIGPLPEELNNLTNLLSLDLHGNSLSGNITSHFRQSAGMALLHLDLSSNQLGGEIPVELPQGLVILDLSSNRLQGSIPQQALANLTALEKLDLASNNLTGSIPNTFGNHRSLVLLDLSSNPITGGIPAELCRLKSLEALVLRGNKMQAPLPDCIGDLASLQVLLLSHTQVTGPAPSSMGKLANLKALHLDGNQLTGSIPAELGKLRNLSELNMSNNLLAGPIPFSRSFLQRLGRRLELAHNLNLCLQGRPQDAVAGIKGCEVTIVGESHPRQAQLHSSNFPTSSNRSF